MVAWAAAAWVVECSAFRPKFPSAKSRIRQSRDPASGRTGGFLRDRDQDAAGISSRTGFSRQSLGRGPLGTACWSAPRRFRHEVPPVDERPRAATDPRGRCALVDARKIGADDPDAGIVALNGPRAASPLPPISSRKSARICCGVSMARCRNSFDQGTADRREGAQRRATGPGRSPPQIPGADVAAGTAADRVDRSGPGPPPSRPSTVTTTPMSRPRRSPARRFT